MSVTAFLTDSTLCIGCKACEVACKEWNGVDDDGLHWSGFSYDNTRAVGASTWRHVKFVEQAPVPGFGGNAREQTSWTFSSDVCKHCEEAGCLEACPTYILTRTEMDSPRGRIYQMKALAEGRLDADADVVRHLDFCLGCRGCETACPSGVHYGALIEQTRAWVESNYRRTLAERLRR